MKLDTVRDSSVSNITVCYLSPMSAYRIQAGVRNLFVQKANNHHTFDFIRQFKGARMSKKPIIYGDEVSPPVRFALIVSTLLRFEFDYYHVDLFKGENKTEFYKMINPLQKVPALSIDEEIICDSHAIVFYICSKTSSEDLYSKDNMLRAKVDQMIFFNATSLFPIDSAILSEYFSGKWPADRNKVEQWYSAIDYLELHLKRHKWLTGNKMQLCDICCATTLSSLGVIFPPLEKHVKTKEWMDNMESMDCFEINRRGVERLRFYIQKYGPAFDKTN